MKKLTLAVGAGLLLALASAAHANCVGPVVMGNCLSGTEVRGYGSDNNSDNSSSRRSYDYNLNNPADRSRYSTDLDAQRRDRGIDGYVNRTLDQGRGQYGGGYRSGSDRGYDSSR